MSSIYNAFSPLADFFFVILRFLHENLGISWSWSIVLLTVIVRIALIPLTWRQIKSMRAMQALQPSHASKNWSSGSEKGGRIFASPPPNLLNRSRRVIGEWPMGFLLRQLVIPVGGVALNKNQVQMNKVELSGPVRRKGIGFKATNRRLQDPGTLMRKVSGTQT